MITINKYSQKDQSEFLLPPSPDEIEVSVFGRGYGESILVHLTHNNWVIVDSCINPNTNLPAPLDYLNKIGVDPSTAVKQVIATHWHSDHIKGIGDIYKTCTSANFVCSDALDFKEFVTLVNSYENNIMAKESGILDFKKILKELMRRNTLPIFASENSLLWKDEITNCKGEKTVCNIISLSPCALSKIAAMIDIKRNLPKKKDAKRSVIATSPNRAAVVLWISIGEYNLLLGSDLEDTGNAQSGWSVIVNSKLRPEGKVEFFKIPHHGSENAHSLDVWQELLKENHISVLTPFINADKLLPSSDDVNRICSLSTNSFSASSFRKTKIKACYIRRC